MTFLYGLLPGGAAKYGGGGGDAIMGCPHTSRVAADNVLCPEVPGPELCYLKQTYRHRVSLIDLTCIIMLSQHS